MKRFSYSKNIIFLIILGFGFSGLFTQRISADENDYSIEININSDFSARFKFNINIQNNDQNSLVQEYELKVPFVNTSEIYTNLNGGRIDNTSSVSNEFTTIKVNFGSSAVKPGQQTKLEMGFKTSKVLSDEFSSRKLYIPDITGNWKSNNVKYLINYPKEFGTPVLTSAYDFVNLNDHSISISTNKGLLIIWGSELVVDVKSQYTLSNEKEINTASLINLIPEGTNQQIVYKSVKNGEYGLIDSLNNHFALSLLDAKELKDVGFEARVKVRAANDESDYPERYNWEFNLSSPEGQKLFTTISKASNDMDKMKQANDYLVSKMNPYQDEHIDLSRIDDIWKRLEGDSSFNSFEYCYVIVSLAEKLGMSVRINYGYLINPASGLNSVDTPHVWCDVKINAKTVQFDPYLEDITGVGYFDQIPIDRIKFGTWHPSQNYNSMIGLIGNSKIKIRLVQDKFNDFLVVNPLVSLELSLPSQVFSGESYSGKATFNNKTNYFIPIKSLEQNNDLISIGTKSNSFTSGLLPNQENVISISNLREKDFLTNGNKEVKIAANLDNAVFDKVEGSAFVNFQPDNRLVYIIVIIVGLFILILFLIFIRVRILKRKKYLVRE